MYTYMHAPNLQNIHHKHIYLAKLLKKVHGTNVQHVLCISTLHTMYYVKLLLYFTVPVRLSNSKLGEMKVTQSLTLGAELHVHVHDIVYCVNIDIMSKI